MKILITGANGYIGSCLLKYLEEKNIQVIGVDKITKKNTKIYKANLLNKKKILKILKKEKPNSIIHLAGESTIDNIANKKNYLKNNVIATKNLIDAMKKSNIKKILFSSTAAVYKFKNKKLNESDLKIPNNIYGKTKLECENLIKKSNLQYIIFRFFNVCSAINRLKVGESHSPETHFIPILIHKVLNKKIFKIYGNNFKTKDGTCCRDYIHIENLCRLIFLSLKKIHKSQFKKVLNFGTGNPVSILEIIKILNNLILKLNLPKFEYKISQKRKGDIDILYCSNDKLKKTLNFKGSFYGIKKILFDEVKWQQTNKFSQRKFIY